MKVTWGIADIQNVYGAEKTSQTSIKPFIIPKLDDDIDKTDNTQKTNSISAKVDITDPNWYEKATYSTSKDIAKTGSIKLPDNMLTKTETTRSDEEILKDIEELAKEHARVALLSGNKFEFQSGDKFEELKNEYISSVSPDRESILKNSTNEILERIESEMSGMAGIAATNPAEEAKKKNEELIDYLMKAIGAKKGNNKEKNDNDIMSNIIAARGNNIATSSNNIIASRSDGYYTQVDIDLGGGKITSLTYDIYGKQTPDIGMKGDMYDHVWIQNSLIKNANFYDSNGELIMLYDGNNNRTDQLYTKAEAERSAKMTGVYNAAFDAVYGRHKEYNGTSIMDKAYNSTYERLRSGVA